MYNVKNRINEIYDNFVKKADSKKIGILTAILFAVSLIPIIHVGLHNYASGDDYWFSVLTYRAWVETGSVWETIKASCKMVVKMYTEWQGTWFTLFLFTLSPNNFMENGYFLTVFIGLGLLIGSFSYLADFYLVKKMQFTKGAAAIVTCMILYLVIQYMPRTTSGIFWFNGIMHYSVPLLLAVFAVVHTHKFAESKQIKDYIILLICFTLLGGGSYLAPISASLAAVLILVCQLEIKEFSFRERKIIWSYDWRNLWVLPVFAVELVGLAISFMAPGNNVRGGEEFGFSVKWALQCVYYAIDRGIYLGADYFLLNGVNTVVYLILAVVIWNQLWRVDREKVKFRLPLLFVIYMNGIYWASYTPEIYARSDVSGGVPNTYFHIFLIVTFANMIYVHGWVQDLLQKYWERKAQKEETDVENIKNASIFSQNRYKYCIGFPGMVLGMILLVVVSMNSAVDTTNDYCFSAIKSGKLERYAKVREEQHRILSDESIKDAVVPEMGAPYPLLHMLLTDENDSRNIDRAKYYNKNSVKAEKVK